ncbi:lipid-A-disaccharide synthase [Granulosicoccaceae sp. 1_MG-2023]|nr:lipid-A-disaccharide synthase [Granulosicoccaceae sp. 1_MG-2023]
MSRPYKVMFSAGEASGDMHAANALRSLKAQGIELEAVAVGGPKLAAEGAEILLDCRELSVIGIFEVLIQYRRLLKKLNFVRDCLREQKPDLLVIVDYPDFNLKLAETARELGIPVLFYVSPQVWAWREHRVHRIGSLVSMMAVIFPFEVAFYEKAGVPVRYVGHPLVDEVGSDLSREQAREALGVAGEAPVVALLPGSRRGEVGRILPVMRDALEILRRQRPDVRFLLPVAGTLEDGLVDNLLGDSSEAIIRVRGRAYDVMQAADAVLTASGTATLETAMMGTPMAIVYRVNWLSYAIMSRMIRIPDIGLVNIVAGRRIVQEFVQKQARPEAIAAELQRLLDDPGYAAQMRAELAQVQAKMGEGGASDKVAALIGEMLTGKAA